MRYLVLTIVGAFLVSGCISDDETGDGISVSPLTVTPPTNDELVIENCHVVVAALEAYAQENGGLYPNEIYDQLPDGRSLVDFLPAGELLVNPYTEAKTEPQNNARAASLGETGYVPVRDASNERRGYIVDGMGENSTPVITLVKDPD